MLWAITVYLVQQRKPYVITLVPALFMTVVCTTFLFTEQLFSPGREWTWIVAAASLVIASVWFALWLKKLKR